MTQSPACSWRGGFPARPMYLEAEDSWFCLMEAYKDWVGSFRWLRLGGRHRALGDCESARRVLIRMSKGRGSTFTPTAPAEGDPVPGPPSGTVLAVTEVSPTRHDEFNLSSPRVGRPGRGCR
ncbi:MULTISPECIES: hypothetical protein [Streptomyces]|uniref:hypothetical protein n=1 Tax=Streptomyces TaxID=1883 RepID=UPI00131AFDDB|nr:MULTISPECIES: hypothetical protein [Streptomyces]MDI5903691.1 hypothetical protein [Streptomyces sp. 12257]